MIHGPVTGSHCTGGPRSARARGPGPRKKPRAEQERGSARRKDTVEERKGERSGTQAPAAGRHTVLICQLAVSNFLLPTDPTDKDVRAIDRLLTLGLIFEKILHRHVSCEFCKRTGPNYKYKYKYIYRLVDSKGVNLFSNFVLQVREPLSRDMRRLIIAPKSCEN